MAKEKTISLEPLKENIVRLTLVGDTDLILHARSRYYVQCEVWKQSHDKGAEPPAIYKQGKNIWEGIITSIHWEKPIQFHDEDISLYLEEEWRDYITNNRPCILTSAFVKSFKETFITFYKDSTGKAGTDFSRGVNIEKDICPVDFASARIENSIVSTMGAGKGAPVLASCNVFSGWRTEITISCPQVVFPLDTLVQIVATSGKYIGIGTQRGNGYGRYHIESADVISR